MICIIHDPVQILSLLNAMRIDQPLSWALHHFEVSRKVLVQAFQNVLHVPDNKVGLPAPAVVVFGILVPTRIHAEYRLNVCRNGWIVPSRLA